jgi:hypothetical protein
VFVCNTSFIFSCSYGFRMHHERAPVLGSNLSKSKRSRAQQHEVATLAGA